MSEWVSEWMSEWLSLPDLGWVKSPVGDADHAFPGTGLVEHLVQHLEGQVRALLGQAHLQHQAD